MSLSEREKNEIDEVVAHYHHRPDGAVEALRVVQGHRRWISDETLNEIADYLQMGPTALDALATFYSAIFRRPVGRHLIMVCDAVCCWLAGYEEILDHIQRRWGLELGGTSADGRFTLVPSVCLGACDQAPAMMVDWELYGDLTPAKVDTILQEHR